MAAMNSTLSKSQNLVNLGSLKLLQVQLVDWAATWAKSSDTSIPPMSVDMPDIVTLLQALGYKLRKLEAHPPHDISNLSTSSGSCCDGNTIEDRGVRVVVTCGRSGQICVLESPLAAEKCRCTKLPEGDISSECFWEVTAIGGKSKGKSSLIESGCDALPNVSKEVGILVANVLNYLCDRIIGNKELEQVEIIPLQETPISSKNFARYSDSFTITTRRGDGCSNITPLSAMEDIEKFRKTPAIVVPSPIQNGNDSPARYRSLDTLTSAKADKILPEPGHLIPKDGAEIQKSMDQLSIDDPRESSTSTIGDSSFNSPNISKLKEVYKLIQNITSNVSDNNFNTLYINKINQIYKILGEISLTINDRNLNTTNLDKLKKAEKMIGDIIKKVDKDTSTDKEKIKSNSASNIIQKIVCAPQLSMSAQVRGKVSKSNPNFQSKPFIQPKQVVTIKKRNRIASSSSVLEKTEVPTFKRRPLVRSSTNVSTKQPIAAAPKKTINKFAYIKSTIPKPEPPKRKD